jgi:hypothetical protein
MEIWPMYDGLHETTVIESIKMRDDVLEKILDGLDADAGPASARAKRAWWRRKYRNTRALLCVYHRERNMTYRVITRNISEGGIGFLHRQMMNVGQQCHIMLQRKDGRWLVIKGVIVRSRHIRGMVHEIGLRFHTPLGEELLQALDVPSGTPQAATADKTGMPGDSPEPLSATSPEVNHGQV